MWAGSWLGGASRTTEKEKASWSPTPLGSFIALPLQMLASFLSFLHFRFFSDPLAFLHPSFLREHSSEHPVLSSSFWDTFTHCPVAILCCLCSNCHYLCVRPWSWCACCLPTQTQSSIFTACRPICYTLCKTQNRTGNQEMFVEWLWLCKPPF